MMYSPDKTAKLRNELATNLINIDSFIPVNDVVKKLDTSNPGFITKTARDFGSSVGQLFTTVCRSFIDCECINGTWFVKPKECLFHPILTEQRDRAIRTKYCQREADLAHETELEMDSTYGSDLENRSLQRSPVFEYASEYETAAESVYSSASTTTLRLASQNLLTNLSTPTPRTNILPAEKKTVSYLDRLAHILNDVVLCAKQGEIDVQTIKSNNRLTYNITEIEWTTLMALISVLTRHFQIESTQSKVRKQVVRVCVTWTDELFWKYELAPIMPIIQPPMILKKPITCSLIHYNRENYNYALALSVPDKHDRLRKLLNGVCVFHPLEHGLWPHKLCGYITRTSLTNEVGYRAQVLSFNEVCAEIDLIDEGTILRVNRDELKEIRSREILAFPRLTIPTNNAPRNGLIWTNEANGLMRRVSTKFELCRAPEFASDLENRLIYAKILY